MVWRTSSKQEDKFMRKYEKKETDMLTELYCNRCGKKLHVENGIAMEGVLPVDITWGYFSKKRHAAPPV